MAGQDFAHNAAPSRKPADKPAGASSILPTVAILFVAGACFAGGYWLGSADIQQTANKTDIQAAEAHLAIKDAKIKLLQAHIENLDTLVQKWKDKANQGAHTKVGELRFYKDLPKQSVMPAPILPASKSTLKTTTQAVRPITTQAIKPTIKLSVKPQPSQASAPAPKKKTLDPTAYRIQIASFRSQSDAAPMRQQLLKAGFPAFIHAVDLGSKGQWFRVYAGPFVSKSTAQDKQSQIEQQMHLKGLLLRGS
ncbi:MAG: SPOR domain-containing protein [Mariprofundus sp.]|nr:SPOR domain-containing protein [Mariprofundus sp.]